MRRMASNDFPLVTTFVNFGPGHTHATIEAQAELTLTNDQSKFTKMFDLRDGKNGRSMYLLPAEGETGQSGNPPLGPSTTRCPRQDMCRPRRRRMDE